MKIKTAGPITAGDLVTLKTTSGKRWLDVSQALGIKNSTVLSWIYNKDQEKLEYETTLTPDQYNMAAIQLLSGPKRAKAITQLRAAVHQSINGQPSPGVTPAIRALIDLVISEMRQP